MIRSRVETPRYRRVLSTAVVNLGAGGGLKSVHGHWKASRIERLLPIERLVALFEERFSEPSLNPTAELTFSELAVAFPDVQQATLEEALSHWVDHSGEKMLQTKLVDVDSATIRVWYMHGLHPENIRDLDAQAHQVTR